MTKRYAIFITALFCAFIGVFMAANAIAPDREFSPIENRVLQQMPTASVKTVRDGSFMRQFETYLTDQFYGRDTWTAAKAVSERMLGKKENNGVYFCSGDTLIARFDEPDPQQLSANLGYVEQFAQSTDVPVYFSLIPGAVRVWADKLPAGAPNADQGAILTQAQASVPSAQWYDTDSVMMAHKGVDIY